MILPATCSIHDALAACVLLAGWMRLCAIVCFVQMAEAYGVEHYQDMGVVVLVPSSYGSFLGRTFQQEWLAQHRSVIPRNISNAVAKAVMLQKEMHFQVRKLPIVC